VESKTTKCKLNAGKRLRSNGKILKGNSATTPAQRQQQKQLDAGNNASAMWIRTPAQCRLNAIAALARPSKAITVGRLRVQQQGHGRQRSARQRHLTNNRSQLRHDWADASL
jgi:hypothetical protein